MTSRRSFVALSVRRTDALPAHPGSRVEGLDRSSIACTLIQVTTRTRKPSAPARAQPPTSALEIRERVNLAAELFELGFTESQVVKTLTLPPVRRGEIDPRTKKPKVGGLGLTKHQAQVATRRALRQHDVRWTTNRAYDRIAQKMILEAAIQGAMRDRKWNAVAALSQQLARITGTLEPIEVQISSSDVRRQYVIQMIAGMPESEFAEAFTPPVPAVPTLTLPGAH